MAEAGIYVKFPCQTHGLFLKLHNLANRQDAKVAKTNKFDVSACGETTSGKLGVLGVLAVKNAAYVVLQEKTMVKLISYNIRIDLLSAHWYD